MPSRYYRTASFIVLAAMGSSYDLRGNVLRLEAMMNEKFFGKTRKHWC
jgi:hypothetical protein